VAVAVVPVDIAQNTLPLSLQSAIPMRLALVGLAAQLGLGVDLRAVIQLLQLAVPLLHPAAARAGVMSLLAVREDTCTNGDHERAGAVAVEDLEVVFHHSGAGGNSFFGGGAQGRL
jgi:hypothetical protein